MIIDTGRMVMPHDGIELWLDNTVSVAKLGKGIDVIENNRIILEDTKDSIKPKTELPDNVSLIVKSDTEHILKSGNQYAENQDLELAGEVYEINFDGIDFSGDEYKFNH